MKDEEHEEHGPTEEKLGNERLDYYMGCLSLKAWSGVVLLLLLAQVGLMIGSLGTKRWVTEGWGDNQWFGGLTSCYNCPSRWRNRNYEDIAAQLCSWSDPTYVHYCNIFEDLRDAGGQFLFFELVSIAVVLAWMVKFLTIMMKKNCLSKLPWTAYTYGLLATFFHWTGIILWGSVTDARFDADCDSRRIGSDKPELCGSRGPIIAIVVAVMFPLINILHVFVYIRLSTNVRKPPKKGALKQVSA